MIMADETEQLLNMLSHCRGQCPLCECPCKLHALAIGGRFESEAAPVEQSWQELTKTAFVGHNSEQNSGQRSGHSAVPFSISATPLGILPIC